MASVNCKNLLELVEVFEDNEAYYVVTKLMPHGDLFNYICQHES
jgi:serine/threonine protein kinase